METTGPSGSFEGSVRDENICPEDGRASSALGSKRSRKDRKCDLRKSLAWNPAFFSEEGVLDPSELSVIAGSVITPSCKVPCNSHLRKSPGMRFDKFCRTRLSNVKEKVSCKRQPVLMSRSNEKDKLSFSEASTHNELSMLMCSKKMTSMKGMSKDLPYTNARHTRTSSVSKQMHFSCGLPSTLKQAKQKAVRMQSPEGKFKNEETEKSLVEEKCIGQLNSYPSSSTKSQSERSCSYSAALKSSISHEPHLFEMPSVPIQVKPSALRMPSPSLGFFQQKKGIPSRTNQSQKTSQAHIPNVSSFTTTSILKNMARFKPSVVQNDQQSNMAMLPIKADVNLATARSTKRCMSVNGPVIPCGDFEACADNMSMKYSDINDASHASARESSKLENAKVGITTCSSSPSSNELATFTCSQPQIGSKTAENVMISQVLHSNCSQRAASSNQYSVKSAASKTREMCTTSEICFYEANESISDTKIDILMEPGEEPEEPYHVEKGVEHYHASRSQVQQATPCKAIATETSGTSSQDVKLLALEEWQLRDGLRLYKLRNDSSSVKGDGPMLPKKVSLDRLKQEVVPLKHQLNAVPFSDEWIAAIEVYGEDILKVKTGTVQNSPIEKAVAEPGPWSPVKKAQEVGPFDCTKYTRAPAPSMD
ncbi:hypothetical protein HPP92_026813 [Vanilla planifolia]|uniref:Uncharacterized protein n=1 Tax=Vanilla planifolia TaxID=51239 RepID=A0A835PHE7_VANPL|nr:hypothetical protein HPP92_026813 [Vanilla planifolia]KAG0473554.1 hypothetical protein HPP92_015411 [Vanilla planifolia]